MIHLHSPIPPDLVEPLEEYFCETLSPWTIVHPRPEDEVTLNGYFDTETGGRAAWAELRDHFSELPGKPVCESVRDEDWMESYKLHLHPWSCGPLQWVPEWERETFPVPEGNTAVYLDSGLAFGTGSHETTRLCATALVEYLREHGPAASVIDAGCGSGILALSAVKLGFSPVHAFDNDPEAVRVTAENAVTNKIEGEEFNLAEAGIEDGLSGRTADLVLANIQSNILCLYADELCASVNPGGWLALSGILHHEAERVALAFADAAKKAWKDTGSPDPAEIRFDGDWALVLLRNRAWLVPGE